MQVPIYGKEVYCDIFPRAWLCSEQLDTVFAECALLLLFSKTSLTPSTSPLLLRFCWWEELEDWSFFRIQQPPPPDLCKIKSLDPRGSPCCLIATKYVLLIAMGLLLSPHAEDCPDSLLFCTSKLVKFLLNYWPLISVLVCLAYLLPKAPSSLKTNAAWGSAGNMNTTSSSQRRAFSSVRVCGWEDSDKRWSASKTGILKGPYFHLWNVKEG